MYIQSTKVPPTQRTNTILSSAQAAADSELPQEPSVDKLETAFKGLGAGAAASLAGAAYPSTWLHEMGHAKMIELMYNGPKPEVEVFPFKGGVTRWRPGPLTEVGQKFGPNGARVMVSAAGTLVDMGVATASFGIGFKMRKEHPVIGTAMMGFGAMTVLNSISYAATAVGGDLAALAAGGHDFASIAVRTGLHPLASIAIMASVLPLQYAAMSYLEKQGL